MRILFVHQNFPGQFPHLAPALAARGHEVMALTDAANRHKTALRTMRYAFEQPKADFATHGLAATFYQMTERGRAAARASVTLRDRHGFHPDVIMGNLGWGETLFLKEVWPKARLLIYAEFFYHPSGYDVGFDPEFGGGDLAQRLRVVARQAHLLQAVAPADAALAPTRFQAQSFPDFLHDRIAVIHDGVDTARLCPNPSASFALPGGRVLRAGDEVLTFINRNLEPYRGYHIFMRALPEVLAARPDAQVVIVGGDGPGYGPKAPGGKSWKEVFLTEVAGRIDLTRVHFTGRIPYDRYVALMQVSRVHAYLTYPFVLSWSLMEALAVGAHVVASRTAPVEEMIRDGETGQLVDFFDVPGWSRALVAGLADPVAFGSLRAGARASMVQGYDLRSRCLPRLIDFVENAGR